MEVVANNIHTLKYLLGAVRVRNYHARAVRYLVTYFAVTAIYWLMSHTQHLQESLIFSLSPQNLIPQTEPLVPLQ